MTTNAARVSDPPVFRVARLDSGESARLLADYEAELAGRGIVLDRHEGGGVEVEEMIAPQGVRLYSAAGYREIPDYNGNPHAGHWMEKAL